MNATEAIAREQIRRLIARYNHAGDRGRLDELVTCFAEDGVMELPEGLALRGREAIHAHLSGVVADFAERTRHATLRHHVASVHIELQGGDEATSRAYFSVYTEIGLDHWGGYRDRLRRIGDEWLLVWRRVWIDGASPGSRMLAREGT